MPVVVKEAADRQLLEIALVENLQRADLNPLEEAQAFTRLADEFGMTQERDRRARRPQPHRRREHDAAARAR